MAVASAVAVPVVMVVVVELRKEMVWSCESVAGNHNPDPNWQLNAFGIVVKPEEIWPGFSRRLEDPLWSRIIKNTD